MCNIRLEKDQVWFSFTNIPNILIGAIYNTPRDSPFFNPTAMAIIQEQCLNNNNQQVIIIGDLNARMENLNALQDQKIQLKYTENPDSTQNENGKEMINFCQTHNIVPVNHMIYRNAVCDGELTFKRKNTWISQLDWVLCSKKILKHVKSFKILKDIMLQTDHAAIALCLHDLICSPTHIKSCAGELGAYNCLQTTQSKYIKPAIKMQQIDQQQFKNNLPSLQEVWHEITASNIEDICTSVTNKMYNTIVYSKKKITSKNNETPNNTTQTWRNIIALQDPKMIWTAINWKGNFDKPPDSSDTPSDQEFCEHFERLLNPEANKNQQEYTPSTPKYIPDLDAPIQPMEVSNSINKLKTSKAPGPDGIAPGIFKILPDDWILMLTFIYNAIFTQSYPKTWSLAKVFTIFKKGTKSDPGNYRRISIMSAIAKVYDIILSKRFILWYTPFSEQAGAQKNRGCEEQILAVRLMIDVARKTKEKLYIAFIDYQKAYDKINRKKLIERLDSIGCGTTFLMALQQSMSSIGIIGGKEFLTSAGVKQGGGTSCNLFTSYIDPTISAVKSTGPDGWLKENHILLFMDDTVVFATSRNKMEQKLQKLKEISDKIEMKMHPTKSKFLTINTSDVKPFKFQDIEIEATKDYVYLGAPLSNNSISKQIEIQLQQKYIHVTKFS